MVRLHGAWCKPALNLSSQTPGCHGMLSWGKLCPTHPYQWAQRVEGSHQSRALFLFVPYQWESSVACAHHGMWAWLQSWNSRVYYDVQNQVNVCRYWLWVTYLSNVYFIVQKNIQGCQGLQERIINIVNFIDTRLMQDTHLFELGPINIIQSENEVNSNISRNLFLF